jgi:hypothetical protein
MDTNEKYIEQQNYQEPSSIFNIITTNKGELINDIPPTEYHRTAILLPRLEKPTLVAVGLLLDELCFQKGMVPRGHFSFEG